MTPELTSEIHQGFVVTIKAVRPHSTREELEVVSFGLFRSVAKVGKYPPGSSAVFFPAGARNRGRVVKGRMVHGEWSHGELELPEDLVECLA